jgi:hypothetical protein
MTSHAHVEFSPALFSTEQYTGKVPAFPRLQLDFNSFRSLNHVLCLKPSPRAGESRFACHLAIYFPEIAERIDENDFGVLHLEVGALKLASREAIINGDWAAVSSHCSFVAALLKNCGEELNDALCISYLGSLFYGETARNFVSARTLLPPSLAIALENIERHYQDLAC